MKKMKDKFDMFSTNMTSIFGKEAFVEKEKQSNDDYSKMKRKLEELESKLQRKDEKIKSLMGDVKEYKEKQKVLTKDVCDLKKEVLSYKSEKKKNLA
jgi:peptidoglycan hydrolase CwlO-like protein